MSNVQSQTDSNALEQKAVSAVIAYLSARLESGNTEDIGTALVKILNPLSNTVCEFLGVSGVKISHVFAALNNGELTGIDTGEVQGTKEAIKARQILSSTAQRNGGALDHAGNQIINAVKLELLDVKEGKDTAKGYRVATLARGKGVKALEFEITPVACFLLAQKKSEVAFQNKARGMSIRTGPAYTAQPLEAITGKNEPTVDFSWATKALLEKEAIICLETGEFTVLVSILELDAKSEGLPYSQTSNGLYIMANGRTIEEGLSAYKLEPIAQAAD